MPSAGGPSQLRRAMPADFEDMVGQMSQSALREHYQCSERSIRRWALECGMTEKLSEPYRKPLPDNLAELAATRSIAELAEILEWRRETLRARLKAERHDIYLIALRNGAAKSAAAGRRAAAIQREAAEKRRAEKRAAGAFSKPAKRMPLAASGSRRAAAAKDRINSEADAARAFLQRFGPCFSRKVYGPHCEGYVSNNRSYTAEALIDEAVRRGWDPDSTRFLTP